MLVIHTKAKLNLCLHIENKRADGYHNLQTIVAFCKIGDELNFKLADDFQLNIQGKFSCDLTSKQDNIIYKTVELLQEYCGKAIKVEITLQKNLPIASGIGGGSGDAASTLIALNQLCELGLNNVELSEIGLRIGADVPVCLYGKSCLMQGIGEKITPLFQPNNLYAVLINPLIHISTADVFKNIKYYSGALIPHQDFITTLQHNHNDLQQTSTKLCPEISIILEFLKSQNNVLMARMSGSGATCFALCDNFDIVKELAAKAQLSFPKYWVSYGEIS
jgi:4-diphosphocytidyl-2-C-methyl-D-erythritol kinase